LFQVIISRRAKKSIEKLLELYKQRIIELFLFFIKNLKNLYLRIFVIICMTVITVRINEEIKKMMNKININWSEFIREAIRNKIEEERRRNLAKAVLINERIRKKSKGEMKAEEIIREFRNKRYVKSSD